MGARRWSESVEAWIVASFRQSGQQPRASIARSVPHPWPASYVSHRGTRGARHDHVSIDHQHGHAMPLSQVRGGPPFRWLPDASPKLRVVRIGLFLCGSRGWSSLLCHDDYGASRCRVRCLGGIRIRTSVLGPSPHDRPVPAAVLSSPDAADEESADSEPICEQAEEGQFERSP